MFDSFRPRCSFGGMADRCRLSLLSAGCVSPRKKRRRGTRPFRSERRKTEMPSAAPEKEMPISSRLRGAMIQMNIHDVPAEEPVGDADVLAVALELPPAEMAIARRPAFVFLRGACGEVLITGSNLCDSTSYNYPQLCLSRTTKYMSYMGTCN